MIIEVEILDKKKNKLLSNTIKIDSTGTLEPVNVYEPREGEVLEFRARSDNPKHFECFIKRDDGTEVCFGFEQLKIGEERVLSRGVDRKKGSKFTKTPWRVAVEKMEEG